MQGTMAAGAPTMNGHAPAARNSTPAAAFDPERIPPQLRERPQWVCWKYILKRGKRIKCPFNARDGTSADSTAPATWSSFDEALKAWRADSRYAGIGYRGRR